jgi:hypothetical protein
MFGLFVDSSWRVFYSLKVNCGWCPWSDRGPPIISLSMLAEITALLFSVVALALSAWFYISSVTNRSAAVRTQRLEAKAEALRVQLDVVKRSLQDQQEKLAAAPALEKARPAIVADAVTIADWNNNSALRELLKKHGYGGGTGSQKGK